MELRQQQVTEQQPFIAPRLVPGPREPTPEERALHDVAISLADWCTACQLVNATSSPHKKLTFDQLDISKVRIVMDHAYMKTSGEWTERGAGPPHQAELFSKTLIAVGRDTMTIRAMWHQQGTN